MVDTAFIGLTSQRRITTAETYHAAASGRNPSCSYSRSQAVSATNDGQKFAILSLLELHSRNDSRTPTTRVNVAVRASGGADNVDMNNAVTSF